MHSRRPVVLTLQAVHGTAVGLHELLEPQIDGIDAELLGDFIELNFQGKARLGRAVAALGSARPVCW